MKAQKTVIRTAAAAVAAGTVAWLATIGGGGSATAGGTMDAAALKSVADQGPGYMVEDFGYPDADKILTERHITLKQNDGHIVLADCGTAPDLLEVWAREKEKVCFKVTGARGYLALEIPAVFAVRGNNYSAQVDMTVGTEAKSFNVNKNGWTPVGESADEQGRDFMLMEIRTTR